MASRANGKDAESSNPAVAAITARIAPRSRGVPAHRGAEGHHVGPGRYPRE